jgi:hypothetical protein
VASEFGIMSREKVISKTPEMLTRGSPFCTEELTTVGRPSRVRVTAVAWGDPGAGASPTAVMVAACVPALSPSRFTPTATLSVSPVELPLDGERVSQPWLPLTLHESVPSPPFEIVNN